MTANGWIQIAIYAAILLALARPLGGYMTAVFEGRIGFLRPVERVFYALCGVDERQEQHWLTYGFGMLLFHAAGFALLYALQRFQFYLPFNPQGQVAPSPDSAFNTAVSFTTNTNWQSYTPESTMGYLVQMTGLTVHNFISAAAGIALSIALIRGFARRSAQTIGNFWVDMTRCVLYILLPLSMSGRWCWSGRGFRRTSRPTSRRRPSKAANRSSRKVRLPRRRSSRNSGRMAAASSTPIPPIPMKTQAP